MTLTRVNPLSFVQGDSLVFQFKGKQNLLRLSAASWCLLREFYQLPSLAPRPQAVDPSVSAPLLAAGVLVQESELGAFLRRERIVTWCGDRTAIQYLLAAHRKDRVLWYEFNGRIPVLFVGESPKDRPSPEVLTTFDGCSFGCERYGPVALTKSKAATTTLLAGLGCSVPSQVAVSRTLIPDTARGRAGQLLVSEALGSAPCDFGFPVVVKLGNGSLGRGMRTANSPRELAKQLVAIARLHPDVPYLVVERVVQGREWRVTAVGGDRVMAYERIPFTVIGDGSSTLRQLVDQENRKRRSIVRRERYLRPAARFRLAGRTKRWARDRGLAWHEVIQPGRELVLAERKSFRDGALLVEATDELTLRCCEHFQRLRETFGLSRAGFDVIGPSLSGLLTIIEVNSRPHLWPHVEPDVGRPQPAADTMVHVATSSPLSARAARDLLEVCRLARNAPFRA